MKSLFTYSGVALWAMAAYLVYLFSPVLFGALAAFSVGGLLLLLGMDITVSSIVETDAEDSDDEQ